MNIWKSVVGKLWITIILLVAFVITFLGLFLLVYIDVNFERNSQEIKWLFVYAGIIGFLLTTFFAFFLFTKITQPLLQLKKAADSVTKGEYKTRVEIRSSDEIGQLASRFNHMTEKLDQTIRDLHHEKEQLDSILRSMTDVVITFDASGNILLANPQGEKLIEHWAAISWEKSLEINVMKYIPEPLQPLFKSVVENNEEQTSKLYVQNDVWSVVITPLYAQDDLVRGAVAVLRNVTEEDRLEKLRKDFVANVSHELRTPLSMLQGYSEALLDDIAGSIDERKELAQIILDESLRMSRLVKDLLDLAKMEAGHLEMNCEKVNITSLVERVTRKFSTLANEHNGVSIKQDLADKELWIECGDEDRLEQVLTNLLDNGLRHTPKGAFIFIRAYYAKNNEGGPTIRIEIEDQGEGIPQEDLPYIFERFYKADKARTRIFSSGGTGLGLSIVKNIVESHEGMIQADSKVGKGTTFSIELPCNVREHTQLE
ncbi:HAMP domain-containing sensor histidine kinase [Chengkuizengella axinellae]|uniref:histidine kinase n=1 Tax=Chengkuizengella axinellae TaxID=3064388 RepID=A0ABT9IY76_9BACL|nr:ATP-binding protein [Chengkuizengella sp. 2205SS18-9]MDP5273765.1 ATP-binding protein [Chengkuizengella sp. 2205SS18-9]